MENVYCLVRVNKNQVAKSKMKQWTSPIGLIACYEKRKDAVEMARAFHIGKTIHYIRRLDEVFMIQTRTLL